MSQHDVDLKKRRFLTAAASVVAGAGAVMAAIPFVQYMTPSDRARAAGAPVEADISKLEVGQLIRVKWRGQPVWFVRRTEEMLKNLETLDSVMLDPDSAVEDQQPSYAQNKYRSIKDELLVANYWLRLVSVPIWVVHQPLNRRWAVIWVLTGRVASSAPVMARSLIWLDVPMPACLHR